ncbi:MAG: exodeoxyribonuclease VII small subunit [Thermomicrobiales bacterium]|nr:exodeoxyribonuclease VII small subunit [Thermomicrobiales bacterium]
MTEPLTQPTPFAEWEWTLDGGAFEDVYTALDAVVAHLESGNLSLSETMDCYELGMRLASRCEQMLAEAELRVGHIDAALAGDAEPAAAPPGDEFEIDVVPF